jgi:hypothetical protein
MHIGFNMLNFFQSGNNLERNLGTLRCVRSSLKVMIEPENVAQNAAPNACPPPNPGGTTDHECNPDT